jgi:hypothetical protein
MWQLNEVVNFRCSIKRKVDRGLIFIDRLLPTVLLYILATLKKEKLITCHYSYGGCSIYARKSREMILQRIDEIVQDKFPITSTIYNYGNKKRINQYS